MNTTVKSNGLTFQSTAREGISPMTGQPQIVHGTPLTGPTVMLLLAGLMMGPTTALAQDECGPQAGATPVVCDQSAYTGGVSYDALGDLNLTFSPNISDIGGNGVQLSATGTDSISFDSATTATELQSNGLSGALLDVETVNGNSVLMTEELDADGLSPAGVTHGVRAVSTGSGNIAITTTGAVDAASGANPAASIGIEAQAAGGDISIETSGGSVLGNQYGVRAATSGTGTLSVSAGAGVDVGSNAASGGAIDLSAGAGNIAIVVAPGTGAVHGRAGTAIRAMTAGDIDISIASGRTVQANTGSTVMDLTSSGSVSVTNAGTLAISNSGTGIQANANTFTLNNTGTIQGAADLDINADVITINSSGSMGGITATGSDFVLNNEGSLDGELDLSGVTGTATVNQGVDANWRIRGNVVMLGAISINNAGTLEFFGPLNQVVSAQGASYSGISGADMRMLVQLDGTSQSGCDGAVTGQCFDLRGGTTSGVTSVRVDLSARTFSAAIAQPAHPNAGIVLVDVSGGTSGAGHFVLDPTSQRYAADAFYGGVLDLDGLLDYALLYNPDTQQHVLASVPQQEAIEYAFYVEEVMSLWHHSADAVTGRQADVRAGATGNAWVRAIGGSWDRDATPTFTSQGNTFNYNRPYSRNAGVLMLGFDITAGEHHVLGVHGGLVSARRKFDSTGTSDTTEGAAFGLYGGWWQGGFTFDAAFNVNVLELDHSVRSDEIQDTQTSMTSMGLRADAGWRFDLSDALYLQPMASLAIAQADIEELGLRGGYDLDFEDAESLRAGLGMRLGGETTTPSGNARVGYWLLGRAWDETAGDGRVTFATDAAPLAIEDDLSGRFEEVGFGLSVSNPDNTLSTFVSGNALMRDDGDTYALTIGGRVRW